MDKNVYVEELLGAQGRIRVLRVLSVSGELNISEVTRRTGMNHTSVKRHLEKLKEMRLVSEKRYGKIRIFKTTFKKVTVVFENGRDVRVNMELSERV